MAEKPRDAVVKFDTYRNLQRHRAVLLAIAELLFQISFEDITQCFRCNCSVIQAVPNVISSFYIIDISDRSNAEITHSAMIFTAVT